VGVDPDPEAHARARRKSAPASLPNSTRESAPRCPTLFKILQVYGGGGPERVRVFEVVVLGGVTRVGHASSWTGVVGGFWCSVSDSWAENIARPDVIADPERLRSLD